MVTLKELESTTYHAHNVRALVEVRNLITYYQKELDKEFPGYITVMTRLATDVEKIYHDNHIDIPTYISDKE